MDPERWKQVDSLFQSALERPLADRDAFLRQACAGDQELEREVRELLTSDKGAGTFLETPAMEAAARSLAGRNAWKRRGPDDRHQHLARDCGRSLGPQGYRA